MRATRRHRLLTWATLAAITAGVGASAAGAFGPPPDPGFMDVPHCVVPRVHGMKTKKARLRLISARCAVGFVFKQASHVKKGRVINTVPAAGTALAAETAIDLYVSRGRH